MKVQVHYINQKTLHEGHPIHTLPASLYHNFEDVEEYLEVEVKRWNINNKLISWKLADNSVNPNHIPLFTLEAREKEVNEVWAPQLEQIATDTCTALNIPIDNKGFSIKYNKHYTGYAKIRMMTREISIGNKFFLMSDEHKRQVIQHEIAHPLLKFKTHSQSVGAVLAKANIPLHAHPQYAHRREYKYEVYCPQCMKVVARKRSASAGVIKNPSMYRCRVCKCKDLIVKKLR